jgi:uncharacterized protein (UPF0147 family)
VHSNENYNDGYRKKNTNSFNSKKRTRKEKELLQNKTNQENLAAAMIMLENINRRSNMNELLVLLKDKEQKFSLSVRAANALSILDGMTQDKRITQYIVFLQYLIKLDLYIWHVTILSVLSSSRS